MQKCVEIENPGILSLLLFSWLWKKFISKLKSYIKPARARDIWCEMAQSNQTQRHVQDGLVVWQLSDTKWIYIAWLLLKIDWLKKHFQCMCQKAYKIRFLKTKMQHYESTYHILSYTTLEQAFVRKCPTASGGMTIHLKIFELGEFLQHWLEFNCDKLLKNIVPIWLLKNWDFY